MKATRRLPDTVYWYSPPRNDCATECANFAECRENLMTVWRSAKAAQEADTATDSDIDAGFNAIRGLQELMASTWNCVGRMDPPVDSEEPCRNPSLTKIES